MAKITNIEQLREHALATIERLANQEIDTQEAAVTGKLCEGIILTVKAQLEYSRMIADQNPQIAFMETKNGNKVIEHQASHKQLNSPKR